MSIPAGKLLLSFSFILISFIPTITLAQPEFISYFCNTAANFTLNSPYKRNLHTTLAALPTTDSGFGFFNSSTGDGNNRVNSVALCRGDVSSDVCRSCLNDSIVKLRKLCPNQKEAIGYYDNCLMKYSSETILGNTRIRFYVYLANLNDATNIEQFNSALRPLMDGLRIRAASGGRLRKFDSGNTTAPDFTRIYGVVQCTPDLSEIQCSDCLEDAINRIGMWFNGKIGGRILLPMCNFRICRVSTHALKFDICIKNNVLKPGSTRPVGPVGPGPGGETGLTKTGLMADICSDQPGRNTIGTPFPVHLLSLPHPAAILPHSQRRTPSDEEHHRRSSPSSVPVARSSPSSVPVAFFPILFLCHFSEIRPPSSIACFFPILFLCHFSEFKSKRKRKPNEFKSIRKEEMIDSSSNQIQIQTKTFKRSIRVQIRSKSKRKPSPLSSISCWSDSGKLSSEAKKKEVKLSGEAKKKEGEEPDSSHFRFFLQFQSDDILICV
ncbi:hypothetical protein LXL04_002640 [Taraxacum kok-saghyz]